jgi:hypothetical protein
MSVDVAMFGLNLNFARQAVSPAVARVTLEDLDRRRAAPASADDLGRYRSCFNFYLMSPLDADVTVPDDAIDAMKITLGRAFRSNSSAVRALKQLCQLAFDRAKDRSAWALVEANGNRLAVRPTHDAFSRDFLTTEFEHWPDAQRARFAMPSDLRIMVEYVTSDAAPRGSVDADWDQFAARLATYADAPAAEAADGTETDASSASPRDAILVGSLTAAEAVRRAGSAAEDAVTWASRERKAGRLFGVWSSRDRAFVHPEFQFNDEGGVNACLGDLLRVLRLKAGFNPATTDKGGWARAFWLYQPRAELSSRALASKQIDTSDPITAALTLTLIGDDRPRSPAEAFGKEPHAVIELAQSLANEGTGAHDVRDRVRRPFP